MAEHESTPWSYYASIFSGACLLVSELLPYMSKVKGNGILQVLIDSFGKYEQEKQAKENDFNETLQNIIERLERLESTQTKINSSPLQ